MPNSQCRNVGARGGLAAAALLAATAPAFADERDEKIRELERLVREQAAEQTKMRNELAAMKRDEPPSPTDRNALRDAVEELLRSDPELVARAAPASKWRLDSRLDLGGYFSTRFANSELPGEKPSFQDMRFVLQTKSQISRAVRFAGEIEFEHGGVSDEVDGEVKVEYAQLLLGDHEAFALKAGSLLQPWGRFNTQHDDPLNELSSRPTVSRLVHGTVFAAPGLGVEGSLHPSEKAPTFNYDLTLTNGLANEFESDEGIREARTLWEDDENHDKTVAGRLGMVPTVGFLDAVDMGSSFLWGKLGEDAEDEMRGWGVDLSGRKGPIEFKGEWAHLGVDRESGSAPPIDAAGNLGPIRGMQGWYAQALYRFTDPWVRTLPFADKSASVAMVVRRDSVDTNDRVIGAAPADDENAWTFGINYRPSTKTVIKLEYRYADSSFDGEEGRNRDLFAFEFATYF